MCKAHQIFISTMDEVFDLINFFSTQGEKWIFRGQNNAKWSLASSLERTFERFETKDRAKAEQNMLETGKRSFGVHQKLDSLLKDDLDVLAYIQHYGGVTRLVDFSDSFSVALFFAMDTCNNTHAAVWCLKRDAVNQGAGDRNSRRKSAQTLLLHPNRIDDVLL